MHEATTNHHDASGLRIGIARSAYHADIVGSLFNGAKAVFLAAGGSEDDLLVVDAPGAFELVVMSRALAHREDVDGVVALGCVISGETSHDMWINGAVSQGLASISIATGKPVSFGVVTCDSHEQALARAGGAKGNKGDEAMAAAIAAVRAIESIRTGSGTVSS